MNVVIYVCHVDDGILGCGGTIPQMIEAGHEVNVVYITKDYNYHPDKNNNDNRAEATNGLGVLDVPEENIHFLEFPTMKLDTTPIIDVNIAFEELGLEPDVILTLDPNDVNQDHWTAHRSAMIVGRSIDRQIGIATMEVLSSSEWGEGEFEPNFYVDISETIDQKVEAMSHIESEFEEWPHPRSAKGIRTKAQQRGMEVGLDYAEGLRLVRWFDFDEDLTA
jgi:LmbE family N-acetylglucosaminyl deacetylase